ncbi:MAG: riboflavin synthase [Bdellovibrionales bacterium]|nr:riboflavin synthase [Bdellovibrionales bacterium]
MFSGIVEESARVHHFDHERQPARLVIESALDHSETKLGDSICIGGVCLTVVQKEQEGNTKTLLSFDLADETLRKSTHGTLVDGQHVNLERSLSIGSRLHGHFVFGHVDGVIELVSRTPDGACDRLEWRAPTSLMKYIAPKGSASLSGVSLTVGEVTQDTFSVYIVPHTDEVTTLSECQPGDKVNIEIDMLARYVDRILQGESPELLAAQGGVS